jgi:phosphoglycolate phosphatase-like HAD superfamily hydrolase
MKKYFLVLFTVCVSFFNLLSAEIHESFDIQDMLIFTDKDTLVVTDLNHVLMETTQPLGSDHWAAYEVKKQIAETGTTKLEVLHKMVPMWHHILMESEFKAVEPTTAGVIRKLQQQGNHVIGLTARYIEMAYPTVKQLQSIGIDLNLYSLSNLDHEIEGGFAAKYVEGVIFVGLKNDKGETLMRLLDQLDHHPKKILFIDDKEKNLHSVSAACDKRGIPFVGLRYGYLDEAGAKFDPIATEIELKAFIERKQSERKQRTSDANNQASQLS